VEFIDALAIVRDLADQNVLGTIEAERFGLEDGRTRQLMALEDVDAFLDLLRGNHS
jgi:hypothetical protein